VTCLIFIFFVADSLGRRKSFMVGGAIQAFCMFFIGFYLRFGPAPGENNHPPPAGIAALAMIYIFAAAFNMSWGPVSWIYVSEIPTNRLRAYNVALASFTHWVHNLAVSKSTPVMLLHDPYRAYFIFGSFNLCMAIAAYWIPETKGVSSPCLMRYMRRLTDITHRSRLSVWTRCSVLQISPRSRMWVSLRAVRRESTMRT
jgi:uncharacterized protein (DUF486 family)